MTNELPPPEPGEHRSDHDAPAGHRRGRGRSSARPNYTVRRAIVGGGILAMVAIAIGVVIYVVVSDESDGADATAPTWNAIVEVDRATGEVTILDADGDEVEVVEGSGRAVTAHPHQQLVALVRPGSLAVVDTAEGTTTDIEVERTWTATPLRTGRSLTFVVAPSGNGGLVIVDGSTGDQLDVGELTGEPRPLLFADSVRSDPDGSAFAIGDGRLFQTVVVRFGDDEATFFPGVPMAVGDDLVVTSTNVGTSAELGLFTAEGERLASITSDRPVGGIIADERFVYVTEEGRILAADPESNSPTELGTIAVPGGDVVRRLAPALDQRRLVAIGDRFVAIVDLDGEVVYQTTFSADRDILDPWSTWRCFPVGGADEFHSLIDLESGEALADISTGTVRAVSADGCAVHMEAATGQSVITARGETPLPSDVRAVHLSPDGRAAVTVATDGSARLVEITDGGDDAESTDDDTENDDDGSVDLGQRRGLIVFVDR